MSREVTMRIFRGEPDEDGVPLGEMVDYEVELDGRSWSQKPVKYQAKSLKAIRAKYAEIAEGPEKAAVDEVLEETGCLEVLAG